MDAMGVRVVKSKQRISFYRRSRSGFNSLVGENIGLQAGGNIQRRIPGNTDEKVCGESNLFFHSDFVIHNSCMTVFGLDGADVNDWQYMGKMVTGIRVRKICST